MTGGSGRVTGGPDETAIERAAGAVSGAGALLIGAGAGMGVDSGLPDFRGPQGFWRAYPPYERLGLSFTDLADPRWFATDPPFAWGFYGHRLGLYRRTRPHEGFAALARWAGMTPGGHFVLTSNVDGGFQRAGFDPDLVAEAHGSVHWMQCTARCGQPVFPADPFEVRVDESTMRAADPLPSCPRCGALARPNILMFGDRDWDGARTSAQLDRLDAWLGTVGRGPLVAVEFGAGKAVPTVRRYCEQISSQLGGTLVRVNPREPDVPPGQIGVPMGALDAIRAIDARLTGRA